MSKNYRKSNKIIFFLNKMAEGGEFDDLEMRDRYKDLLSEEEEEDDNEETSFLDARENLASPPLRRMISPERSHKKLERVDIPDIRKDAGGMKKSMTEDKKRSIKKYLV